jgi:hypothetical protein
MKENCKAAMAAAVAGGYFLGRTKKAKLALAVGTYLAGRRFSMSPSQLATQGLTKLRETPQFQDLTDQMRHEVLNAGRAAVTAAARRKLLDLSDSLRDRSERLSGAADRDDDADEDADAGYDDEDSAAHDDTDRDRDRDRDEDDASYEDDDTSGEDDLDDEDDADDGDDDEPPASGRGAARRTSAGSAGLRSSAANRGTARRATVRRAASTGPAVANAAVKKKAPTRSGSGSGSGTRRGK